LAEGQNLKFKASRLVKTPKKTDDEGSIDTNFSLGLGVGGLRKT
jgi:hypothetical protein